MPWTAPRTWTTGEIVTASMMNTHIRDNFNETAPAKAVSLGDLFYATGPNAIQRLPRGSSLQILRVAPGGTIGWTNPPGVHVPLVYRMVRNSSTYGPICGYTYTHRFTRIPLDYTAYFIIHWGATAGDPRQGQATIALRDITANRDVWSVTVTPPVWDRRDRVQVSLNDGHTYQIWGKSEQDGQIVEVLQSCFEFI